jgi:hypothetical protein
VEGQSLADWIGAHRGGQADVVFVAHTGLEFMNSLVATWRILPLDGPILARYSRLPPGDIPEDARKFLGDGLVELGIGAGPGFTVGPPTDELGGVPESVTLEVVVADLGHPLDAERLARLLARLILDAGHDPDDLTAARGCEPLRTDSSNEQIPSRQEVSS